MRKIKEVLRLNASGMSSREKIAQSIESVPSYQLPTICAVRPMPG